MPTTIQKQHPQAAVSAAMESVRTRGQALAAEALPKLADAAQRAGETIGQAARTAGDSTARGLQSLRPNTALQLGAAIAGTSLVGKVIGFAMRRPLLTVLGGVAIASAASALLHKSDETETATPSADEPTA